MWHYKFFLEMLKGMFKISQGENTLSVQISLFRIELYEILKTSEYDLFLKTEYS